MGKPSKASRRNGITRLRQRQKLKKISYIKQIETKEEEIGDLQIEVQRLKKFIEDAGEKVIDEFMKSEREKQNLLKWINFYTEQIKDMEKKQYLNKLKTYINTSQSSPSQQSRSSQFPQQSQTQQPSFKSLDDYFKYEKEQKDKGSNMKFD
ncbi:hypothetical protein RclHR1_32100001 [Rhizophagus clarus]|uniref:Uncharacterized protein n=1 Tax=Rhizophagus clarus TaxID=94130 RepID=A0A2Z6R737_9GLOM|nr:hypothetical protein RclHR1_12530002 [Rhizophagus clarus]GBB94947.1 hypothetical protein RclHR1_24490002 [Rhizophagus clarus]GBB96672.1 hypothetical protein RclHR1_28040002 [Rhizophagus clarus]GBB98401.1 hypothetical protein RclHR1_32100001 [Rhizophagus clarus]GES82398.1 hypothetical protein RCL_jg5010.t1 [Rhizophagus clarus]